MANEVDGDAQAQSTVLRRLAERLPSMLAYWDADLRCRFANRAYERWFGKSPESLIGTHISELLGPQLYPLNLPYMQRALRGEPQEFEREIPDPAGGPARHSLATYMPDIADGVVRGFFVQVTDVSELVRARLALQQSEAEHMLLAEAGAVLASSLDYQRTVRTIGELVVDHLADICIVDTLDDDDKVLRMSVTCKDPAKKELCVRLGELSLDRSQIIGRTAIETREPQLFAEIDDAQLAKARSPEHREILRALGTRSALAVPLLTPTGVQGALVLLSSAPHHFTARDVRIATEIARRAALAIENARLYEAARRATHARDEVLGIVAHDVRSPLNAIALAAETLARQPVIDEVPRARAAVELIARSVARANRLIADLLDISRMEGNALTLNREVVAVSPVVGDVLRAYQLAATQASIELHAEVADGLRIVGDSDRVLQVLENLVGNAMKFTPAGGRITIKAAARPGEVLFSVADTGAGIPAEALEYIFDRFWQVERARRTGAGLGLTISKGIVEAHGGTIWVESVLGEGTAFYFTIPAPQPTASQRGSRPELQLME